MHNRQVLLGVVALSTVVSAAVAAAGVEKAADPAQPAKGSHAPTRPQAASVTQMEADVLLARARQVVDEARERHCRQAFPECVKALMDAGQYEEAAQLMGDGEALPQPRDGQFEDLLARARQVVDQLRASKASATTKR